jgi:hypothetical protein
MACNFVTEQRVLILLGQGYPSAKDNHLLAALKQNPGRHEFKD